MISSGLGSLANSTNIGKEMPYSVYGMSKVRLSMSAFICNRLKLILTNDPNMHCDYYKELDGMGLSNTAQVDTIQAALNMLTRRLAVEWKDDNIRATSFCPGWVKTDLGTQAAQYTVSFL